MAEVNYTGGNVTASSTDTINLRIDPTTFTSASSSPSGVVLTFGGNTLTITGATLTDGGLANVFVPGGTFAYLDSVNSNGTTGNTLAVALNQGANEVFTAEGTSASSKVAIFGGATRADILDNSPEHVAIGGKGAFLVATGNGDDSVDQTSAAFDSTSVVNIFTGNNADTVTLTAQNKGASIFVGAGNGQDQISVTNSGTTTIFGGNDSSDGADTIVFNPINGGVAGAGGTSTIFGNGGADTIFVGGGFVDNNNTAYLDSTSTTTIYGGVGNDEINVASFGATVNVYGNEDSDTISVFAYGTSDKVFVTGGNQGTNQENDQADNIFVDNSIGTKASILVYGNLGADNIEVDIGDSSTASIYGGKGGDEISVFYNNTDGASSVTIYGGENGDDIVAANNGGVLNVYGGVQGTDTTDGNDNIEIGTQQTSTGLTFVYANSGNDNVTIGQLGRDSVNATTVFGGVGKDNIEVLAQNDSTAAGAAPTATSSQKLVIYGNEDQDTFTINQGTGTNVTIADMNVANGTRDSLVLNVQGDSQTESSGLLAVVSGSTFTSLQDALDAAARAANTDGTGKGTGPGAAAVVYQGDAYVVIDGNQNNTFQAGADQAIKLTGVTDLAGLQQSTVINQGGVMGQT